MLFYWFENEFVFVNVRYLIKKIVSGQNMWVIEFLSWLIDDMFYQ